MVLITYMYMYIPIYIITFVVASTRREQTYVLRRHELWMCVCVCLLSSFQTLATARSDVSCSHVPASDAKEIQKKKQMERNKEMDIVWLTDVIRCLSIPDTTSDEIQHTCTQLHMPLDDRVYCRCGLVLVHYQILNVVAFADVFGTANEEEKKTQQPARLHDITLGDWRQQVLLLGDTKSNQTNILQSIDFIVAVEFYLHQKLNFKDMRV